ncbi:hypothetical protein BRW84_07915 [Oxalobacter formigenes OXCC13]|nr:hypothetical protein BRW84_07915 [Oxalobacter formigenes OXCC13]
MALLRQRLLKCLAGLAAFRKRDLYGPVFFGACPQVISLFKAGRWSRLAMIILLRMVSDTGQEPENVSGVFSK